MPSIRNDRRNLARKIRGELGELKGDRGPPGSYRDHDGSRTSFVHQSDRPQYHFSPDFRSPSDIPRGANHSDLDGVDYVFSPPSAAHDKLADASLIGRTIAIPRHHAPSPPANREIGTTRWHLVKKIGEGGQGRCDLFQKAGSNQLRIFKQMKGKFRKHKSGKPLEVVVLDDILGPHPRIIDLQYHNVSGPKLTMGLEYCSGGDLGDFAYSYQVKGIRVPESFIWHTYIQLSEALAYIHTGYTRESRPTPRSWQAILHRDIKPDNVFLRKPSSSSRTNYPDIVLADFGIAKPKPPSGTQDKDDDYLLGTVSYQGPELVHSREGDVWSAGACIHTLVHFSPPIKRKPPGMRMKDWIVDPNARYVSDCTNKGYSVDLDSALVKAMRKRAQERLIGRDLVKRVERGRADWGGKNAPISMKY